MVQNAYQFYWDEKLVNERLDQKMTTAFQAVHHMAEERRVDTRVAAYMVAVNRVAEAVRLRGWV
jgi:glutamate dehydrogenase (NAD(P)+)